MRSSRRSARKIPPWPPSTSWCTAPALKWNSSAPLEEQSGWELTTLDFMDDLVDQGVIVLGGPLSDEHRVVHVMEAESEEEIRSTLARDPWSGTHLVIAAIEPWTIRLDARGLA